MIKSMTGFGRSEHISDRCKIIVEMKGVNHRYCDINLKLPRIMNYMDSVLRSYLKKKINRGKIDVFVSYEDLSEQGYGVKTNIALGREYYQALSELGSELGLANVVTPYQISRFAEVLSLEDKRPDQEYLTVEVTAALDEALEAFVDSRSTEGQMLEKDIRDKLEELSGWVGQIEERYPEILKNYRERLRKKLEEMLEDVSVDEARIAAEMVIYADKTCVDEETVRLRSHIEHMKEVLSQGDNIGRKLDFIAQEMNREANTILSKSNDIDISNYAIELKTGIEKIREQVQNIE